MSVNKVPIYLKKVWILIIPVTTAKNQIWLQARNAPKVIQGVKAEYFVIKTARKNSTVKKRILQI